MCVFRGHLIQDVILFMMIHIKICWLLVVVGGKVFSTWIILYLSVFLVLLKFCVVLDDGQ